MTRVVIVQDYVPEYRVAFFERLVEAAQDRGIDVAVAVTEASAELAQRRDRAALSSAIRVSQREFRVPGRRFALRRLADVTSSAELVILEQARRNLDAYRLVLGRRPPLIALWGHGRDYTVGPSPTARRMLEWLTRHADWLFAYTSGGAAAAVEAGMAPNRLTVVQNSLETETLRRRIEAIDDARRRDYEARWGLAGRSVLFLGALDASKRLDRLFAAAELLSRDDRDFRLLVAGEGPLRTLIEHRAGAGGYARLLGRVDADEKALALRVSRAIVMPGRVGLVAVESFAAQVPIITTDWQYHAPEFEYLEPGVNAIVTRDSIPEFAAGIRSALADPALHDRLVAGCRRSAGIYTLDEMVARFLAGITAALETGPR